MTTGSVTVDALVCADANRWLAEEGVPPGFGIATSPPDAAEIGLQPDEWWPWFCDVCDLIARQGVPTVVYVTDRHHRGRVWSKASAVIAAAHAHDLPLTWHRPVIRSPSLHRPAWSHLIALGGRHGGGANVTYTADGQLYRDATPWVAASAGAGWLLDQDGVVGICDPYCGRGTFLIAGRRVGLHYLGIDLDEAQIAHASSNLGTLSSV